MHEVNIHTDQKYVDALVNGQELLIQEIYKKYAEKISQYIQKNNGTKDDARDLFQEVLTIIYYQGKSGLKLSCPFEAYFFMICKRRWYNELKKKYRTERTLPPIEPTADLPDITVDLIKEEQQSLYRKHFKKLGRSCLNLLSTAFEFKDMKQVATQLNISYGYARKQKTKCIQKLIQSIKSDPLYQELI